MRTLILDAGAPDTPHLYFLQFKSEFGNKEFMV